MLVLNNVRVYYLGDSISEAFATGVLETKE